MLQHFISKSLYTTTGFLGGSGNKESACSEGDLGLIRGLGISPGGGHNYPLQRSCLENPHGALWATVHGVAESDRTEGLTTAQHSIHHNTLITKITFSIHPHMVDCLYPICPPGHSSTAGSYYSVLCIYRFGFAWLRTHWSPEYNCIYLKIQ